MDQTLKLDISFEDEAPDDLLAILADVGAQDIKQVRQRGFTGIEIVIVGILVANALANLTIRLSRLWKCGVVVDARGPRVLTKKNCALPRGTVLVINRKGTELKLHEPSELQQETLLKHLAQGAA
jgi:hypothetical protein